MPLPKLFRRKKNQEVDGTEETSAAETSFVPPTEPTPPTQEVSTEPTPTPPPSFASQTPQTSVQESYGLTPSKINQQHDEESYADHPNLDRPRTQQEPPSYQDGDNDYNLMVEGEPIYVVSQKRGYLSILFSLSQTLILIAMMIQCKVAPMNINPMFGPYPDALSYWGGKNAYFILYENEWWRLISPIMLHAGVFHLICNVAVQLDSGAFWEREWGSLIWLIIYLSSAAGGSCLSVISIPNTVGVGSSGSVCGTYLPTCWDTLCEFVCKHII